MTTTSVNTTTYYAVCACCAECNEEPLSDTVVTCGVCGAACSCAGCVADFGPDPLDRTISLRDLFAAMVERADGPRITPMEAVQFAADAIARKEPS